VKDFYDSTFVVFRELKDDGSARSLAEIYENKSDKKAMMMRRLQGIIEKLVEKSMLSLGIMHALVLEVCMYMLRKNRFLCYLYLVFGELFNPAI